LAGTLWTLAQSALKPKLMLCPGATVASQAGVLDYVVIADVAEDLGVPDLVDRNFQAAGKIRILAVARLARLA
jgi:hypothetical protein